MGLKTKANKKRSSKFSGAQQKREALRRQNITEEAARIIADEGLDDYYQAKLKAANRLGIGNHALPSNIAVEDALRSYLSLFHGNDSIQRGSHLRGLAIKIMALLEPYQPRLAGAAVTGLVTPFSTIQIHVNADTPEIIAITLTQHNIPYSIKDKTVRFGNNQYQALPTFHFSADNEAIDIWVFDEILRKQPPLSPIDGKPMSRATLNEVQALIDTTES